MFLGEASLPPGLRVYAVGDVHGRLDCLTETLALIDRDLADRPVQRHRVVMLGDYGDRGPQTRDVLDLLCRLARSPEMILLLGNHDDWLRAFLRDPESTGHAFLRWGGLETLSSYGVTTRGTLADLSEALARAMPSAHRELLEGLATSHSEGDFFFCHAGVRPGIALENQQKQDLIWIREEFLYHPGSFGKVIVHGHTPQDRPEVLPNRINVDTLAWNSGVLTTLVLEDRDYRFLRTALGPASH